MAAQNRILALDLGTQTVALAEFRTEADGGLALHGFHSTELLADPAADATRHAQAKIAIGEMVSSLGYSGQSVNYSIASQAVFTRFVKLPSMGEEKVDQIVGFEAQQNVPYPIDEVVWAYQLVDSGDADVVEVVIVAIKSDLLDEINDSVEASGLKTATVDVAPMALYNAFRYNYSDLTGCSLIIDIGARSTNLVFVEPKKVFSRSIQTGGNAVTAAISKDFGEPYGASEERKKSDGFVSLGGAYADPDDPDIARLSKIIRNTMTRLHAEIARSITFYRSQQGGSQPVRVFLAGGSASAPYIREFFQEKFQLSVEFFNPLRNVAIGPNVNFEEVGAKAHTLGEVVGLALRSTSACPMELNLRPASVISRHKVADRSSAFVFAGICLLLSLVAVWFYFSRLASTTEGVVAKLDEKVSELKGFEGRMNALKTDEKNQRDRVAPLLETIDQRDYWNRVLADVNSRLPADFIWLTKFTPGSANASDAPPPTPSRRGGKEVAKVDPSASWTPVAISGLLLENPDKAGPVNTFFANLAKSELYTVEIGHSPSMIDTDVWAFQWTATLRLKPQTEASVAPRRK